MPDPQPSKPPTVYITVDLGPSSDGKGTASAPRQPVVWEPPDVKELGRALPGYEVLALIGSGGMGAVYRARQKSLDRLVAVKVLSPELAERAPEFTERFNSEASALAQLSHPSIVHLFDCGRAKDGHLYISMELVEGRDVAERLGGKQALPADEALSITISVCDALAHAHKKGVIHRDIKPANVMLDAAGRVKITDFGLAKILQSDSARKGKTTSLLGTPRFTAPEALLPGAEVDHRADIFSVGVMLYQMLTGEVPRGAAQPPSEAMPGLDERFDAIVAKAMAEDPDERYPDAAKLREALEDIRGVPDSAGLPAATMVEIKKQVPSTAQPVERTVSPPRPEEQDYEREWEPAPQPERHFPIMPWLFTLGIIAVASFWGWQQWKHPDDGILTTPTSVNRFHVTGKSEDQDNAPSAIPAPPPAPEVVAAPPSQPMPAAPVNANTTPAPLPTEPVTSPPSPEEFETARKRIAQIEADFAASIKTWQAGQDTKFAELDAQYLRGLKTSITAMRNARRLADLAGVEEESRLLTAKIPLPPSESGWPPERLRLRGIYDAQVRQIAVSGATTKVEIYNRLIGSLFAYQSILKQTSKPSAANLVAGVMDTAIKERDAIRASLAPAQ